MIDLNFVFLALHLISVVSGVAAGILWMRSASVNVPAIKPSRKLRESDGSLSAAWINEVASNLDSHHKGWVKATQYNKAAATAAAIAALGQAAVYVLTIIHNLVSP
ncbi:hypothetical protein ACFQ3K_13460 [Brucella gallinifaecis]|uniref:Uncharacterized protein n=1 Tax=Brucella gallinifaecis TaxID=215590 RepID=A0A502BS39_9HYPH|nr:hypothetical protein [Brucella gallinifaecis]TPF76491.1 hypothetical protein FHY56_03020 [Brucella gallinifaecis]